MRLTPYTTNKKFSLLTFIFCFAVSLGLNPSIGQAQSSSYRWIPAPDIWYNSIDGVRVGVRLRGKMPTSKGQGKHRLNAGLWLGTKLPTHPLSYYFSFTEPVKSLSSFGSEGSIQLESSYRTGFQQHGFSLNKRWQAGFNEFNYKELKLGFRAEKRFDKEYLLYPQLWQKNWLYIVSLNYLSHNKDGLGRYVIALSGDANVGGKSEEFIRGELDMRQNTKISDAFSLYSRFYTGLASKNTAPEYVFSHSLNNARSWMNRGLTRARGTIPPAMIRSGGVQITGGANLRGYLHQDIEKMNEGVAPLFTSLSSINLELNYPNPFDHAIRNMQIIGDFIRLRSYLFFDTGTSLGLTKFEEQEVLSDAGPGFEFSIDIPDFLGKKRGIYIRYDLPLWLSNPGKEDPFKFRNVLGIGAVISL